MTLEQRIKLDRAFIAASAVILIAMIYPAYIVANRVHPLIFGLPFGLFWIACWVGVEFLMLCVFFYLEQKLGGFDHE